MPRDQIQEVKDKLDIVSVISSYLPLTKGGKNYKALCPFHSEKTPSFMVSPELQIFKCFGCGEGGDVISFYSKMEGVGYGEALREMARRAGVKLVSRKKTPDEERRETIFQINQLAADLFHYLLEEHKVGEAARKYLKGRGLAEETVETFNLGYAPVSWDILGKFILSKGYSLTDYLASGLGVKKAGGRGFYDFIRGRVVFPLRSSTGRVVGFSARTLGKVRQEPKDGLGSEPKYINTPETLAFQKRRFLFNLDLAKQEIKKAREVVLVEGEMDAISLWEKGIKNVVASKGTALTPEQIAAVARFAETVKICFDRDAAGLEATKRGIMLAQGVGLEIRAVIPPSGKDPDEAVRSDAKAFCRALKNSLPIFDFYLDSALVRFDSSAASGKRKIAGELLPLLKSLASEVEKAVYLKKLAGILDVSEEVLWRQMEKEEALEVNEPATVRRADPLSPKREAHLLALLLSLPPKETRRWLRKLSPDDFSNPGFGKIFAALKTYLGRGRGFRLARFSATLEEAPRKVIEELALLPASQEVPSEEEIEAVSRLIKQARYQRELRDLTKAVKAAEAEGAAREVKHLQREVLTLTDKIRRLG